MKDLMSLPLLLYKFSVVLFLFFESPRNTFDGSSPLRTPFSWTTVPRLSNEKS